MPILVPTEFERAAQTLARLCFCAVSPEHSLLAYAVCSRPRLSLMLLDLHLE